MKNPNFPLKDIDLGYRCDWLENQLDILYEYERGQANEISSLKEVIRRLAASNKRLIDAFCELSRHPNKGEDHA